jgi:SAM-dependent methyltransferase
MTPPHRPPNFDLVARPLRGTPMNPKEASEANFDLISRLYRILEYLAFGPTLQRCRTHFLPRVLKQKQALVLGDGDGRFLAALLAANPHLEADAVDTSASMLRLLKHRAQAATTRVHTHQTSALSFTPDHPCDLIATHFFLDCLIQSELNALCTRITPHLTPQALWLVSDFRIPTGTMRWASRAIVRALYLGFRLLTGLRTTELPDHTAALTAAGLTRIAYHHSLAGLLTTELWQLREYTSSMLLPQRPNSGKSRALDDPLPDPEPASPSLPGPDPGVFHHEPGEPPPTGTKPPLPPAE